MISRSPGTHTLFINDFVHFNCPVSGPPWQKGAKGSSLSQNQVCFVNGRLNEQSRLKNQVKVTALCVCRTIGDRIGEAKASGNLGNTLKVLGRYDEAVVCCQRHLDISQEQGDKVGTAQHNHTKQHTQQNNRFPTLTQHS